MQSVITIMLAAVFTDNFVLSKFLGICPFLGVSQKIRSSLGMGAAVIFVMFFATLATYPVYTYILLPAGLEYLKSMAFILLIALFVQLVEMVLRKYLPPLYNSLGIYLPLITTNCAVLGVTIMNIDNGYGFGESLVNATFGGVGFTLALLLFAGVRSRVERADIPDAFKGFPITLIAAAIVSLSFMGFKGI